jgi:hypothetical protein
MYEVLEQYECGHGHQRNIPHKLLMHVVFTCVAFQVSPQRRARCSAWTMTNLRKLGWPWVVWVIVADVGGPLLFCWTGGELEECGAPGESVEGLLSTSILPDLPGPGALCGYRMLGQV